MGELPTELPPLDPVTVADDQALGEAVDTIIRLDPEAQRRAVGINEHRAWLRCVADTEAWKLVLEVEARTNERWSDLAVVLVRYGWEQGRRHPLSAEVSP